MKIKFTILLILNTTLLVSLVYILLYGVEHHSAKWLLSALLAIIILYIFLFFRTYIKYFNTPARDTNEKEIKNNN